MSLYGTSCTAKRHYGPHWYQEFMTVWASCKYSDLEEYEKGSDYDNTMPIVVGIILGVCLGWFSNIKTIISI